MHDDDPKPETEVMTQSAANVDKELPELPYEMLFRKIFGWVVLIATTAWRLFAGSFLAYQARALTEPVPSVTEHTTRAFEPIYTERKSKP